MSDAKAQPSRRRRIGRNVLRALASGYGLLAVALWVWISTDGDRGWLATLVLFGPRWLALLPLPLLAVAALFVDRWYLLALAGAAVVLVIPVMGLRVHWPGGGDGAPTVRVLTCNVEKDSFEPRALAALIEHERPDVVVLQEVSSATMFVWPAGWHAVNRDEFTVASRWPVIQGEHLPRPGRHDFCAVHFSVERPEGTIQVFDVHLQSPRRGLEAVLNRKTGFSLAGVHELERVLQIRDAESRQASEWIASFPDPKIVLGDFNMPVDSAIYRRDWSMLGNAFSTAGWGFGFTKTSEKRGWSYGARIDHVLFSPPWRATRSWVAGEIGSDHRPLFAEFH